MGCHFVVLILQASITTAKVHFREHTHTFTNNAGAVYFRVMGRSGQKSVTPINHLIVQHVYCGISTNEFGKYLLSLIHTKR